jgi:probable rRNA maturation factor
MAPADSRRAPRLSVAVATPDTLRTTTRGLGSWLARAAPAAARGEVVLAIVSDGRMRALNRAYRGVDYATDVLSFPGNPLTPTLSPVPGERGQEQGTRFLGDIVIASGVAARQARAEGHSLQTELRVLALHGLLHLLGYDHESDDGRMARAERRLRRAAGLPEGLIERGQPLGIGRQPGIGSRQSRVRARPRR